MSDLPLRSIARALVFDPRDRLLLIAYEATRSGIRWRNATTAMTTPRTRKRRNQYVPAGFGPTGCSTGDGRTSTTPPG